MPSIIVYLIKCSLGLAALYIFYRVFFRRLTFYNANRWILTGFSLACFLFPLMDVSAWLLQSQLQQSSIIEWVPSISQRLEIRISPVVEPSNISIWTVISSIVAAGMLVMLVKLLAQIWSFKKMMSKAAVLTSGKTTIYELTENVVPFSFGNAIFINPSLHSEAELEKIIRHEFVHVQEIHSADIVWGEILHIVCWYNPFAWLLKKAIRQNLEFIADQKVLQHGFSKKEYQYLLLKVMGAQPFRIAAGFNFSSLKKRIAMMNKNKTSRVHALQFLLLLPVVALLLLSFRKQIQEHFSKPGPVQVTDTIPGATTFLKKDPLKKNIKSILYNNDLTIVTLNNGDVQQFNMNNNEDRKRFEATYGKIPAAPPPPPPPVPGAHNFPSPPPPPPPPAPPAAPPAPLVPEPSAPLKIKKTGEEMSIISDSLSYDASTKSLFFSNAKVIWNNETSVMDGSFQNIESSEIMVLIDGEDFTGSRNYTAPKGSALRIKNLDKKEALKKYGERGKNGAIEIQVIKKIIPVSFFNPKGSFSVGGGGGC